MAYGLLVCVIVGLIIVSLVNVGSSVSRMMCGMASVLGGAMGTTQNCTHGTWICTSGTCTFTPPAGVKAVRVLAVGPEQAALKVLAARRRVEWFMWSGRTSSHKFHPPRGEG